VCARVVSPCHPPRKEWKKKALHKCKKSPKKIRKQTHLHGTCHSDPTICCNIMLHNANHCNMSQHTATRCNIPQHAATHYNTLQHTATHSLEGSSRSVTARGWHTAMPCNRPQQTAADCKILQHSATLCSASQHTQVKIQLDQSLPESRIILQHTTTDCNILQHTATDCNILQHTATYCNTLQHTATHCNTLHHATTHCNTLQQNQMKVLLDQSLPKVGVLPHRKSHLTNPSQLQGSFDQTLHIFKGNGCGFSLIICIYFP